MKKLSTAQVRDRLLERKINFEMVDNYIDSRTPITFKCGHHHYWKSTPDNIFRGSGCPHCDRQYPLSISDINSRLSDRNIKIIGHYINANKKTEFQCKYDHIWNAKPGNVLNGQGCPHCSNKVPLTREQVIDRLREREIELIGKYLRTNKKTKLKCKNNHEWESTVTNIFNGNGCPSCMKCGFDPNKSAHGYILKFESFIKYGITNDLNRRLREHSRNNGNFLLHKTILFENGFDAVKWENIIKNKFGGKYVDKALCPDGWTETLAINYLNILEQINVSISQ